MNKLILLFFFTISIRPAFSQELYQSFPIDIKATKQIKGFADNRGNSCIIFNRNEALHFIYIDDATGTQSQHKIEAPVESGIKLQGVQYDDDNFYFYYREKYTPSELLLFVISKSNIEQSKKEIFSLPTNKKDKFIDSYAYDNQIYFLFSNKKTHELTVFHLDQPKHIIQKTFPANEKFHDFFKKGKFFNLYPETEPAVTKATGKKKIYMPTPDQILLLSDKPAFTELNVGPTEVVYINLEKEEITKKRIPLNQEIITNADVNSYVYEDRIFRLMITSEFLQLSIYDLNTLELINNHFYPKGEKIELIAGNKIYQGATDYPPIATFKTEKSLHKALNRGVPVLTVNKAADGQLKLRIGSVFFKNNGGGPAMMPNGTFNAGVGSIGPDELITYFDCFLDKASGEIVEVADYDDPNRNMADFLEELYPTKELMTTITKNPDAGKPNAFDYRWKDGQSLFGYFDKKKKELILHQF